MDNVYVELANHLNKLPIAFPATKSGVELKILQRWFSPAEAGIAMKMNGFPEDVAVIAERLEKSAETLAPILEDMAKKGLIFRVTKGGKRLYNLVPLAEGMWEFHLNSIDQEDVQNLREYINFFMETSWYGTKTSQHRIIPISKSLSADMEIMPYERAEAIIRSQSKISVTKCICRTEHAMIGEGCHHPTEVCMAFGTGAYYYLENGLGREIDQEEALEILKKAMETGLVLQPGNGQKVWGMCMCCACACYLLKALKKMEKPALVAHTNFFARVNEDNCTGCGLCQERCPMEAITLEDTARVNLDRCIGCGVCAGACEFEAMALVQKHEPERYLPPKDVTEMQMRVATERGLL